MKQTVLFFAVLLIFVSAPAQPVIHAKDLNPTVGEQVLETNAKIKGVKVGKSGANITWNYSNLKNSSKTDTTYFVSPSSTPFGGSFPTSNLAAYSSNSRNVYVYYTTTNMFLKVNGTATQNSTTKWAPGYRVLIYPLTYHTNFIDTGSITSTSGTTTTDQYTDTVNVVGYGKLKLPGGRTFKNVLMAKTTSAIYFTVSGQIHKIISYSISYVVKGYHEPLLSMSLNSSNQVQDVSYSPDAVPSAADDLIESESKIAASNTKTFTVYPNPATTSFVINMNDLNGKTVAAIRIYDMSGKNIFIKNTNLSARETIFCSQFKAGAYFVKIQMTDGSEEVQKLMIVK